MNATAAASGPTGNLSLASGSSSPASSTSSARASASPRSSCWRTPAARSSCRARPAAASRPTIPATARRAKRLARQAIEAFEDCDYVVAPSGSCGGMLVKHYPELFADEPDLAERAERFAGKTHELISFLVDVMGVDKVAARYDGTVAYHDSCSGLRELGVQGAAAPAARRRRGPDAGRTRGGRGLLRLRRHRSRSNTASSRTRSSREKPTTSRATGADTLLAGDLGCLMNMAGKLQREGSPGQGAPCRRGAGRHDGRAGDRRRQAGARPMSVVATSASFKENAHEALADARLQGALAFVRQSSSPGAPRPSQRLPEFEALRDSARAIKDHTLAHLDLLSRGLRGARSDASGGQVHYAHDAEEARAIIVDLCKSLGAKTRHQGQVDDRRGDRPQRTLWRRRASSRSRPTSASTSSSCAARPPSHIIAPAIHLTGEDVEQEFRKAHRDLPPDRDLAEPEQLLAEARQSLRAKFLAADVGITGANFLVAETGTSIIVTNEGNGDLTQTLPQGPYRASPSIEKIVPTLEDAAQLLRVLARSATGQDISVYTTLLDRPAPARRPRRPERISRRAARQRPLEHARRRVRGHAALHPLRRLHEPLPGLSGGRRPRLWLGLSGPDGRGADALADRRRRGRPICRTPRPSAAAAKRSARCAFRLPNMMRHWRERGSTGSSRCVISNDRSSGRPAAGPTKKERRSSPRGSTYISMSRYTRRTQRRVTQRDGQGELHHTLLGPQEQRHIESCE